MATVDLLDPGTAAPQSKDSDNFESGSADMTDPATPSSTPPSLTHDTSRARFHMKDLGCFATCLETSANRAFPTAGRQFSRYISVQALLLMWKDDELGVDNELDGLHQIFKSYGFDTETWLIPSDNPHLELTMKAADFVKKYESEDCLLIVYYGGHAAINPARQSSWYCKSSPEFESISLQWSAIQVLFERAISDVLLLLDCCGAASAAPIAGRAITETIAACGWEAIAPVPGRSSFTGALIEVLEEWIDHPFSVAMLHSQVLSVLKHPQPERRGNKKRKVECRRTPVYIHTSAEPGIPSINLSRLRSKELSGDKTVFVPAISNENFSTEAEISLNTPATYGLDSLTSSEPTGTLKVPHVLISLALLEDQELEVKPCSDWLAAFPALARYATVKGVYRSQSTLIIASVPVVIWDLLPDNPACSFIGYITSDNLLEHRENLEGTGKAEHNQAADANRAESFFSPTMVTPLASKEPSDSAKWELSDVLDTEPSHSTHTALYSGYDLLGPTFSSLGSQSIDNKSILDMHSQGRPEKLIASASGDETARLWDTVKGMAHVTLEGHWNPVFAVTFSPDGKLIASASGDKTVRLWDVAMGTARVTLEGHLNWVSAVAFSPDDKLIASASWDETVKLWDVAMGTACATLEGHSDWVRAVAFSPNGKLIASASHDKTVRLWDAAMGTARTTLKGHLDWVMAVAFSPDSKLIASASKDKTVKLWDVAMGTARATLEGHSNWVRAVAFSPNGKLIASASSDKTVRLWNAATRAPCGTLVAHLDEVQAVAFSPDSKLIASGSRDMTVRLWDTATGALCATLEGHSGWIMAVAFSPNSKLIASASNDKTVRLWGENLVIVQKRDHKGANLATAQKRDNKGIKTSRMSLDEFLL